ncbi:Putative ATP-dependent helicase [Photobacterium profundum SS9]|uniref:ATP-dependent helicase n=1 Tax=Photobacterium profundum (strain SS9) TaxID=298386 RepID=Q6LRG2_PHOPR|nr:Putative ATP-dependent helicase [Photobacterium profundum SS9]
MPLWAEESGRVLVVEPRRVACTALAEYVAASNGETLGKRIGYAIRFDNRFNDNTQVVFVTPGVALRWMIEDKLQSFTTIMIDDFHERRLHPDLLTDRLSLT